MQMKLKKYFVNMVTLSALNIWFEFFLWFAAIAPKYLQMQIERWNGFVRNYISLSRIL